MMSINCCLEPDSSTTLKYIEFKKYLICFKSYKNFDRKLNSVKEAWQISNVEITYYIYFYLTFYQGGVLFHRKYV